MRRSGQLCRVQASCVEGREVIPSRVKQMTYKIDTFLPSLVLDINRTGQELVSSVSG